MESVAIKVCKIDSEPAERQSFLEEACEFADLEFRSFLICV